MICDGTVILKDAAASGPWLDQGTLAKMREDSTLRQAVGEVFELLRDPLYRYLVGMLSNSAEAEDLVQEAFLRLYDCLREGKQVENIRAWVYRAAHNLAVDWQRKMNCTDGLDSDAWERVSLQKQDAASNPEVTLLAKERMDRFQQAVRNLSPQERCCFTLKSQGLPYREIAEVLGLRISTVATFTDRAIKKLMSDNR